MPTKHGLFGLIKALAQRNSDSPLGRMGRQQEVANTTLFLASDESSFITGDRIVCAGGMFM